MYGSAWDTGAFDLNQILFNEGERLLKSAVLSPNMDKVDMAGIAKRLS